MSNVSGPLIVVTRSFDPRELAGLELWLWHQTLPAVSGGTSLATGQDWPGAPDLGDLPGSAADGIWNTNPGGKVYMLNENSSPGGGDPWAFPWIAGARGIYVEDVHLTLVDTGTVTPRTITLTGELTLVAVLRNSTGSGTYRFLDDGTNTGNTGMFQMITDRIQVKTSTTGGLEVDVSPDDFDMDSFDDGAVVLIMLTRDSGDDWRCWVNGVQQAGTISQDGDIVIKAAMQTLTGGSGEVADLLLYSQDWSSRAADLNAYFRNQWGVP